MARKRSKKRARRAKRRYVGSGLWKWNQRRKKRRGGKRRSKVRSKRRGKTRSKRRSKRRHGRRSKTRSKRRSKRRHGRRRHAAVQTGSASYQATVAKLIARGRSVAQAHKIAARAERMRSGRASRFFSKEATAKETANRMANLWANLGAAGRASAALGKV